MQRIDFSSASQPSLLLPIFTKKLFVIFLIFLGLTEFEAYNDKNSESNSLLMKFFVWKYFNTGLVPLLSSLFIPKSIFQTGAPPASIFGLYDDLTPIWYKNVGIGILVSSLVRVMVLAGLGAYEFLYYHFWRLYDTK